MVNQLNSEKKCGQDLRVLDQALLIFLQSMEANYGIKQKKEQIMSVMVQVMQQEIYKVQI
jgi:hypothetical protein